MGETLLVNDHIGAGADFIRLFDAYLPVSVAFWIIPADSQEMILYLASDKIDENNFDVAYGEVMRTLSKNRSPWLDPFQVKLINSSDPIALNAIDIRDRYPAPLLTQYGGSSMGGISIERAYIYPPTSTLKSTSWPKVS